MREHRSNDGDAGSTPPTEVRSKAKRRQFSAEYKRKILAEADACSRPGELGALLRREGLWSSHLSKWRLQRSSGELQGLAPKKRGPKSTKRSAADARIRELVRENEKLRQRLEQSEALIEIQKKLSELWGVTLPTLADTPRSS